MAFRYPGSNALIFIFAAGALVAAEGDDMARQHAQFFENEIRPVLVQRCYECHGEEKQKGGLRLDHPLSLLEGGNSGPALVPGDPEKSLLIEAVRRTFEDLEMPPKNPLPAREVALLEQWVKLGAPWPDAGAMREKADVDEHGFTAEDRSYWFFQPLAKVTPPQVANEAWVSNDVDRFVAAKHQELGLEPAPAADRHEFARRIYFDLHGLPPTREELLAFAADAAPGAHERLIDRLLASPRYGERWAQHWLDLVRYAESDGYRADEFRPAAWPYRDYVIASLNADKPYDQFVREQLAGDELAPDRPEVLVATSYLRNAVYEWNQRDVRGQAELILNDITDNASEVFLGLSMGCARCHDHKFDPILQKDYFALRAFFQPVLWRSDLVLATAEEQTRHGEQMAAWEAATAEVRAQMEALVGAARERNVKRAYDRFTEDLRAMMDKAPADRTPQEHVLATIAERQLAHEVTRFDPIKALKTDEEKARYRELEAALKPFESLKPKPLLPAFVATDAGPQAPPTVMKTRKGDVEVAPAFLTLLEPDAPSITGLPSSTGRRTALANWIVRPDNPLSTRVIANRVWHYHFGRGIAGTPNDLGHLGERPTHPDLLDWLARRFVEGGWSLKRLHKEILMSSTYRQTARVPVSAQAALVDPDNKYLWRYSPRRLDAEQVRDAMLAASGELDLREGGPPQEANGSPRRAIYTIKKRNNQNDFLRSLDAPAGFASIADRQSTATPLQALLFMNGDWTAARARKVAQAAGAVDTAWLRVLGRTPGETEQQNALRFIAKRTEGMTAGAVGTIGEGEGALAADVFRENTVQERLLIKGATNEGDEFTVEAVVTPRAVDTGPAVRAIASRWNGEKSSLEGHGWSLGVAGEKSPFTAGALVMQLVGEDDNMNTAYEAVDSGLRLKPGVEYHLFVRVSCATRSVNFHVRERSRPESPWQTAEGRHSVVAKLGTGLASPVIGGLYRRSPYQFDGRIPSVRIHHGVSQDLETLAQLAPKSGEAWAWQVGASDPKTIEWAGGIGTGDSPDPKMRALADLSHVLLNTNEFLYLH